MKITIRKAEQQDYPSILYLLKEFSTFQKTPEKVFITLEQMVSDQNLFQSFVAVTENKEIIGFASYFFAYYSWTGKAVYLDNLYVIPFFRKQGIGKQLLNAVISLAKNQQCTKVRWQVSKWNTNAIELYKKMGAVINETEINCDLTIE